MTESPDKPDNVPADSGDVSSTQRKPPETAQNLAPTSLETQDKMANRQDWIRTGIAVAVFIFFGAAFAIGIYAVFVGGDFYDRFEAIMPLLLTALGTSLGTVVGYYLGSR